MKFLKESANNLYRAYHGSRQQFDKFEHIYIGSHGLEHGYGFYFTDNMDVAESYGDYILQADLSIKRPFCDDHITVTKDQVKHYIEKYVDTNGDGFIANWSYDAKKLGYRRALDLAVKDLFLYSNSDIDILSELLPEVQNKFSDDAYDAIYKIFDKDGFIYDGYSEVDGEKITNYIVYSNNQILNKKWINVHKED